MKRRLLLPLLVLLVLPASAAANPAPPSAWTPSAGQLRAPGASVQVRPREFAAFDLGRAALAAQLADAPLERSRAARRAPATVSIPAPDGTLERFAVVESPVMEPGLARKHPEISTFSAVGVDDPTATARLDLTTLGFHASVRSDRGFWYVDPYLRGQDVTHVSYFGRDLPNTNGPLVEPEDITPAGARRGTGDPDAERAPGDLVVQRTYRLALLTDPSYATYFGGGANVASANAVLLDRVNQIYNDDLGIKLMLIANNNLLNLDTTAKFSGPAGPCGLLPCFSPPVTGSQCDTQTLLANQMAIDTIIGSANYDIGHLGLGVAGGGIAGLGVVGQNASKARGCTGVPTPKGDLYAVDYFAHEVGHQFGGDHTFNGANGSCSGNENNDTAVEPGSGSSIQAYAGICDADNLQPHSDPYFSQKSIDQIQAYVTSNIAGATEEGSTVTTTANHSPVVTAPAARTIPIRTPFTLTGSATDADAGQSLIYLWEQNDGGASKALLSNAKPDGALFRVFSFAANVTPINTLLSPSPGENIATAGDFSRTFPDAGQVAAGNTNAATGSCPAAATPPTAAQIDCYSEFLPTSARTLTMRLTARDRFATGGGATIATTVLTVAGTAPFRVTSQAAPSSVGGGSTLPITWDVAGTNAAPFNAPNVRILYSTDGGLTFPTTLAASTANDGSENVTIPATLTTQGRFRVEAVGNYFFDVTRGNLTVTNAPATTPTATPTASATATATNTATATATYTIPTATATYTVPTVTPTATVIPETGRLRPDVSSTKQRLMVKPNRKVKVKVRCVVASGFPAGPCRGTVGLFAKIDGGRQRRIARAALRVPVSATRTVTLKLNKRSVRVLRKRGKLNAKLRARIQGNRTSKKQVTLRIALQ